MELTAMAPSPTADAQRLTDPLRTSPAAKTRQAQNLEEHRALPKRSCGVDFTAGHGSGARRRRLVILSVYEGAAHGEPVENELKLRQIVDGISAPLAVMTPAEALEIVNRPLL